MSHKIPAQEESSLTSLHMLLASIQQGLFTLRVQVPNNHMIVPLNAANPIRPQNSVMLNLGTPIINKVLLIVGKPHIF